MTTAEQNTEFRSEGYGTAGPVNAAQQATGGPPQAEPVQPLAPAAAQEPQIVAPDPTQEKGQQNLVQLSDGTPINLDEVLLGPTQRPGEPVTAPLGQPAQPKVSDLLGAMAASVPSADVTSLANLAKRLGL